MGIEQGSVGIDRRHASLEQQAELAVDGGDALHPGVLVQVYGPRLERPVEVVRQREHLADQVFAGQAEVPLPFLGGAASEVGELRAFPLESGQVPVGFRDGFVALGAQGFDLGGQCRRGGVERLDALLGAGFRSWVLSQA
jgi:hypothetical protein